MDIESQKRQKRLKDKSDRATHDTVLDKKTVDILQSLVKRKMLDRMQGCISTGKEANVYVARASPELVSKLIGSLEMKKIEREAKQQKREMMRNADNLLKNLNRNTLISGDEKNKLDFRDSLESKEEEVNDDKKLKILCNLENMEGQNLCDDSQLNLIRNIKTIENDQSIKKNNEVNILLNNDAKIINNYLKNNVYDQKSDNSKNISNEDFINSNVLNYKFNNNKKDSENENFINNNILNLKLDNNRKVSENDKYRIDVKNQAKDNYKNEIIKIDTENIDAKNRTNFNKKNYIDINRHSSDSDKTSSVTNDHTKYNNLNNSNEVMRFVNVKKLIEFYNSGDKAKDNVDFKSKAKKVSFIEPNTLNETESFCSSIENHQPELVSCAIKIYQTSIMLFKDRLKYIISEKRFKTFCNTNPRKLVKLWAEKEVRNLKRLNKTNIPSPKPLYLKKNILIMTLIENKKNKDDFSFNPAPRLKDFICNNIEVYEDLYIQTITIIDKMYNECNLVHSDLSEYNLLIVTEEKKDFSKDESKGLESQNDYFYLENRCKDLEANNLYNKVEFKSLNENNKSYDEDKIIIQENYDKSYNEEKIITEKKYDKYYNYDKIVKKEKEKDDESYNDYKSIKEEKYNKYYNYDKKEKYDESYNDDKSIKELKYNKYYNYDKKEKNDLPLDEIKNLNEFKTEKSIIEIKNNEDSDYIYSKMILNCNENGKNEEGHINEETNRKKYFNHIVYVIDMGQAVETAHVNADEFLIADIRNINKFFEKKGVTITKTNELFIEITKKNVPICIKDFEMEGGATIPNRLTEVCNEEDTAGFLKPIDESEEEIESNEISEYEESKEKLSKEEAKLITKENRKIFKEMKREKRKTKMPKKEKRKKEKLNKKRK